MTANQKRLFDAGRGRRRLAWAIAAVAVALGGCETEPQIMSSAPAVPVFTGPAFLHGTVGSLASVRPADAQPLLVSGWGVITQLKGTGSNSVPSTMRQWFLNLLRKGGFGRSTLNMGHLSADRVMADTSTAAVKVEALIPPGSSKGARIDVLVSALDEDTQTTSLEHGQLYTCDLAIDGANRSMQFARPLARARGAIHVDPHRASDADAEPQKGLPRSAAVISGGVVLSDRRISLVLNQASWARSDLIANRINERFSKGPQDHKPSANAVDDRSIRVYIPTRFQGEPGRFLRLIGHLFLDRSADFEQVKANTLADLLSANPRLSDEVCLAWQALGNKALPVIRGRYRDADPVVRLAALEAGARLKDGQAVEGLLTLCRDTDVENRVKAAALLVHLPESIASTDALLDVLDDDDRRVRLAAYESLALHDAHRLRRTVIGGRKDAKFILDLLPAQKPLIYIIQDDFPRIAVFGARMPFQTPLLVRLWEDRLMLKAESPQSVVNVFYQPPQGAKARTAQIAPTVANLILLMGHRPSAETPHDGLDLSYGEVVGALIQLSMDGHIRTPVVVRQSALVTAVEQFRNRLPGLDRPETAVPTAGLPGRQKGAPVESAAQTADNTQP